VSESPLTDGQPVAGRVPPRDRHRRAHVTDHRRVRVSVVGQRDTPGPSVAASDEIDPVR
jgi:hypothetical protein